MAESGLRSPHIKLILEYFSALIFKETGIVYNADVYYQLEVRLKDICSALGKDSLEDLFQYAKKGLNESEMTVLVDISTNNETSFFRDLSVFNSLSDLLEERVESRKKYDYRIWCAASSTGQEPYSLVMMSENIRKKHPLTRFEITASDLSRRAVTYAEKACYREMEVMRGLNDALLKEFFVKTEDPESHTSLWTVRENFRTKVKFFKQNLLKPLKITDSYDVIMCRNVLIYQNVENKKMIVEKLAAYLKPDGLLVLGGGESLVGITDKYKPVIIGTATAFMLSDRGNE